MKLVIRFMISIGIMFISSLMYGYGCIKLYDLFVDAIQKKSRAKLWWAFSSAIFGILLLLVIYTNTAIKI